MAARWNSDSGSSASRPEDPFLTAHAWKRMSGRRVSPFELEQALRHGRMVYTRGACIYSVGWREVRLARREGVDLRRLEGLHVVTTEAINGLVVLTVFRNRDFDCLKTRTHGRKISGWYHRSAI